MTNQSYTAQSPAQSAPLVPKQGVAVSSVIALIRIYQRVISPLLPQACRFYPTCSEYSAQAFSRYGVLRGFVLTVNRLRRCHPWHPGGMDPLV